MHWDSDLMYSSSYSKLATWLTCGGLLPPVCVTAPLHRVSSVLSPSPPGCAWVSPSPPAPASSSALRRGAAPSASPGPHTPARSPCGSSPWTDSRDEKKEIHLIWFDLFGYILVIMSTLVTCFRLMIKTGNLSLWAVYWKAILVTEKKRFTCSDYTWSCCMLNSTVNWSNFKFDLWSSLKHIELFM